jgi:uncharacterized protein (TIGR02996 family)
MSTEAALYRAIRDNPDDDTVRLVYADCVEEDGDPARGEFIRVQVALARTPEADPARRALEDREHELLAENEARWLGVPPDTDGLVEWEFCRGFVHEVAATPSFMLNEGATLCAVNPVRRWRVQSSQQDMKGDLCEAGTRSWFSRLEAIDLAGWYSTIGELEGFLTRSDFAQLRELDLSDRPGLDDLPGILERTAFREQLKVLRLGLGRGYPVEAGQLDAELLAHHLGPARLTELSVPGCLLTAQDVRQLLVSPCCRELTSLDIRDNQLEPDGWDAFRNVSCRLRELDLSGTPLGAFSLAEILRQDSLADLRVLHLNRCGSAMANIRALAESRFWTQAEELRMQNGTIPEHSLDPLFTSNGPPGLRMLDVSENFFRDAGVRGLCNAKWADSLEWLGLSRNYLTDESLRLLASCGRFTRLRTLHLNGNNNYQQEGAAIEDRITDAGVRALAESPHLANLRILSLNRTQITPAAVEAIVNSPNLRLRGLGLEGCALSPSAIRIMAESPMLARLDWLDLASHMSFRVDALMPLAESEYLSPRCELNVRECSADNATVSALRARLGRRLSV